MYISFDVCIFRNSIILSPISMKALDISFQNKVNDAGIFGSNENAVVNMFICEFTSGGDIRMNSCNCGSNSLCIRTLP